MGFWGFGDDGFATPEELNLTQEEINQLRYDKQKLTDYGREKLRTLIKLAQENSPDAP